MDAQYILKEAERFAKLAQGRICIFVDFDETIATYKRNPRLVPEGAEWFELEKGTAIIKRNGADEFLKRLGAIGKVCICSHAGKSYIIESLSLMGLLEYFDELYCKEDIWGDEHYDEECIEKLLIDNHAINNSQVIHKLKWLGLTEEEFPMHFIQVPEFTGEPDDVFAEILAKVKEKISAPMS